VGNEENVVCCAYPFRKKKGRENGPGRLNIHFAKWIVTVDAGYQTRITLFASARAGNDYLLYTRLLTLTRGPDTFIFEMTLASLKN
jgi:hypothetical protein